MEFTEDVLRKDPPREHIELHRKSYILAASSGRRFLDQEHWTARSHGCDAVAYSKLAATVRDSSG
jgi:hypothetical protein